MKWHASSLRSFSLVSYLVLVSLSVGVAIPHEASAQLAENTSKKQSSIPVSEQRLRDREARMALSARLANEQLTSGNVTLAANSDYQTRVSAPYPMVVARHIDNVPLTLAFVTAGPESRFRNTLLPNQNVNIPVVLHITPTEAVPAANLVVIAGGVGIGLDGASSAARPTKYLPDLPQIGWTERQVDIAGGQNGHIEEDFQLTIAPLSWGYLYAELEVLRGDEMPELYSTILYFASSEHRVLFSYGSLEEIAEFFSGRNPEINSVERRRMRERGEFARITPDLLREPALPELLLQGSHEMVSGPTDPCKPPELAASCDNGKSVFGAISFKKGESWPVTGAIVRLVKEEDNRDICLAQTRSDDSGRYRFCLDDPGDADLSVVVLTSGDHAVVAGCHRSTRPEEDCLQVTDNPDDVFALRSNVRRFSGNAGNQIELNLPHDDQWNADAAKALGIYEAVNLAHKVLKNRDLAYATGGSMPDKVLVAYGNPRIGTSAPIWKSGDVEDANIEVSFADRVDWDVIHHEFGHVVQHYGKLAPDLGGKHRLNVNLCNGMSRGIYYHGLFDHGKDAGTQLAWTEAWATWFSTWIQQSMRGRFDPDFTTVGDLIYENSSPDAATWGYDLESFKKYTGSDHFGIVEKWLGEGNEVAIQRFLWDVGDGVNTGESDKVAFGHSKVWALTASSIPTRLSDFVAALLRDIEAVQARPLEARSSVGELLAAQGISPKVQPATFRDWLFGTSEITWLPQFNCTTADHGVTRFDLDLMDAELSQVLVSDKDLADTNPARNGANSYALASSDRATICGQFTCGTWAVSGRETSDKMTGPYPSAHAKVHPTRIWWVLLLLVLLVVVVVLIAKAKRAPSGR